MLKALQRKGVGTASVEQFSLSMEGRKRAKVPGEKGRRGVVREEMDGAIRCSKVKVRDLKARRKSTTEGLTNKIQGAEYTKVARWC